MTWAPDYVTTAEVKAFVRVSGSADDATIALYASASSRAIDRCCGRQFGSVALQARFYPVRYSRHLGVWVVEHDDLQSVAGLVVGSGVTGYTLEPRNALSEGLAYTSTTFTSDPSDGSGYLGMTAAWGWTAYPNAVKVAALLQSSRLVARRESPFGIAGSPQQGSELRLLERVDPDVKVSLAYYVRDWWAA